MLKVPVKMRAMVDLTRSYLRVFAGRNEIIQVSDGQQCLDPANFRPYHFSPGDMNSAQIP